MSDSNRSTVLLKSMLFLLDKNLFLFMPSNSLYTLNIFSAFFLESLTLLYI